MIEVTFNAPLSIFQKRIQRIMTASFDVHKRNELLHQAMVREMQLRLVPAANWTNCEDSRERIKAIVMKLAEEFNEVTEVKFTTGRFRAERDPNDPTRINFYEEP